MNSKYEKLNDREWLFKKYETEKLSTVEIGKIIGVKAPNSVRQALLRFEIPVRSLSHSVGKKDDGFIFCENVVNGSLLGDGYLTKYGPQSRPRFEKKNKYYDHIEYVGQLLFGSRWQERLAEDNGCFRLRSLVHDELISVYQKWYPHGIKVVPDDIKINKDVLLNWFMDDGYAGWRFREGKITNQVRIIFCSESFTKEDNQLLCDKINDKFNLNANLSKCNFGTGWRIKISQAKAADFFRLIGPPPVASLAYKWKILERDCDIRNMPRVQTPNN